MESVKLLIPIALVMTPMWSAIWISCLKDSPGMIHIRE